MAKSTNLTLYGDIAKYEPCDDGSVIIEGIASSEAVDADGEVITADAMRKAIPAFMQAPAVREMHDNIAAGKVLSAFVDDDGNTHVRAKIVDQGTVQKIKDKVLRGFSIFGKAIKREGKKITELLLKTIDVVDLPNNPKAWFEIVKFDKPGDKCDDPECESHTEGHVGKCAKCMAKSQVSKIKKCDECGMAKSKCDCAKEDEEIHKDFDAESDHQSKYGDVDYADEELHKYPIDTKAHIRAAWSYINMPKNQHGASSSRISHIKSKIKSAAEKHGIKISDDHDTEKSMKKMLTTALALPEDASDEIISKALGDALKKPAEPQPAKVKVGDEELPIGDAIGKMLSSMAELQKSAEASNKRAADSERSAIISKMEAEGRVAFNFDTGVAYTADELSKLDINLLKFAAKNSPALPKEARAIYKGSGRPALDPNLKGSDLIQKSWETDFGDLNAMRAKFIKGN